jgi:hypothetical protein
MLLLAVAVAAVLLVCRALALVRESSNRYRREGVKESSDRATVRRLLQSLRRPLY